MHQDAIIGFSAVRSAPYADLTLERKEAYPDDKTATKSGNDPFRTRVSVSYSNKPVLKT
jgi:hypothetical protein